MREPKYDFFKMRQIRLTKIRHISKYEYVQPKYNSSKVKYAHIWFEEIPLMKNCGTTLERGRNYTWGRQNFVLKDVKINYQIENFKLVIFPGPDHRQKHEQRR